MWLYQRVAPLLFFLVYNYLVFIHVLVKHCVAGPCDVNLWCINKDGLSLSRENCVARLSFSKYLCRAEQTLPA